ncbi:phage antirepressor N-terminal domain-containing protein [Neisseriaceae bacterium CLB008]
MDLFKVPFLGNQIMVVAHNGEPYVAMRSIAEGMDLAWQPQHEKIKSKFHTCVTEIVMQVSGDAQRRAYTCMPLRKLPAWLYSIQPNKVKAEKRDMIIRYQEECDEVLWRYWTTGYVRREEIKANMAELAELELESKTKGSDAGRALQRRKVEKQSIESQVKVLEGFMDQLELFFER